MSNHPDLSATPDALHDDWTQFVDALMRGLGHALNNRLAGLSALADLAAEAASGVGPATDDIEMRELMAGEVERLHELNRVVKLVPQDRDPVAEAIVMADLANDAAVVLAMLPVGRSAQWRVVVHRDAQPVRTERWALLRAVLLLANAAYAAQGITRAQGALSIRSDDERTRITATVSAIASPDSSGAGALAEGPQKPFTAGPALRALVAHIGAELSYDESGATLALPTLQAVRRRERGGA